MGLFLAFDFGASSGRAIVCSIKDGSINMEEIHRFANEPVYMGKRFVWDFPRLLGEMKTALKKAAMLNESIEAIGIDTWGVDYGLIDENENLIGMPIHYRDDRNQVAMDEVDKKYGLKNIYLKNGIANMPFNTAFQLVSEKTTRPHILEEAEALLFMPDLFAYYLTGEKKNEFTIASTSGLVDTKTKTWNYNLIDTLEIPKNILNDIVYPGEIYGYLTEDVVNETGLGKIPVIAIGGHDTASAVAGTPLENEKFAFLSSGTWSLLGIEIKEPIINDLTFKYNFTNEGGVGNTIRLLKNINGLWLIQQLRKNWSEYHETVEFPDIIKCATENRDSNFIIDTNAPEFLNSRNIVQTIKEYCKKNGQGTPENLGQLAMAIYNGLTSEYRDTIKELEEVLGYELEGINVVGGGIQDKFLCELTAIKTGKKVIAGPIEAAIVGNVLLQANALGKISSIEEGRALIKKSFQCQVYNQYCQV